MINLFSIDDAGHVNEWVLTNTTGNDWQPGTLNGHNIIPANASKISATWTMNNGQAVCTANCMFLLLVYQDDKNQFQLCNSTSDAWTFSSVNANPIAGSGVSLTTITEAKYAAQLRLFYQTGSGSMVAADWVSGAQLAGESKPKPVSLLQSTFLTFSVTYQMLRGSIRVGTSTKTVRLLNLRVRLH